MSLLKWCGHVKGVWSQLFWLHVKSSSSSELLESECSPAHHSTISIHLHSWEKQLCRHLWGHVPLICLWGHAFVCFQSSLLTMFLVLPEVFCNLLQRRCEACNEQKYPKEEPFNNTRLPVHVENETYCDPNKTGAESIDLLINSFQCLDHAMTCLTCKTVREMPSCTTSTFPQATNHNAEASEILISGCKDSRKLSHPSWTMW